MAPKPKVQGWGERRTPPRSTSVKGNRQHWGRRLDRFRVKYDLSLRDLEAVIDGALKKSALDDLLSGKTSPRMDSVIKGAIAASLRIWLKDIKKLGKLAIERELLEIFHEPVCSKENEPVLSKRTELPREVQHYFGLSCDPFPNEPPRSAREVFTNRDLDKIAGRLEDAVNYQGFTALIADSGCGKSFMRQRLVKACQDSRGSMNLLFPEFSNMSKVHDGSIVTFILREFGQPAPRDLVDRYRALKSLLKGLSDEGKRIALGFDECHKMDPRVIRALKNFWEIGSGGYERWLGLVLFGQRPMLGLLNDASFHEITKRLNVIEMPNLGKDAFAYCVHRLKLAGGSEKLIESAAITKLASIDSTPLGLGNLVNMVFVEAHKIGEKRIHMGVLKANDDIRRVLDGPKVRAARQL
jgi:type II secretory pathway predicted ATPase ExeA